MQAAANRGPLPVLPRAPSSCACPLEERRDGREGLVALLEYPGKEIEAVRHAFANEVLDLSATCRAQFLREGAVVINKRIGRASGKERRRIVAQVGPRRAGVRVRPVLAVDEISAADEPDEGGIIDDAERREALERLVLLEEEIRDRGEQHRGLRWRDAFIASAAARLPPAESPPTAIRVPSPPSVAPFFCIHCNTARQSSRHAGNGHSGARR